LVTGYGSGTNIVDIDATGAAHGCGSVCWWVDSKIPGIVIADIAGVGSSSDYLFWLWCTMLHMPR
jgi:hypothetical protein